MVDIVGEVVDECIDLTYPQKNIDVGRGDNTQYDFSLR